MDIKAHFNNIHKVIIDHLDQAQNRIVAAVAWFTDRQIFEVLCKKAASGTTVSLAVIGDQINQGSGGLNFHRLEKLGGKVFFLPPGSRDEPTMHHKFCVIDNKTVITGSFNWSQKARINDENITVATDAVDYAHRFLDEFERIVARNASSRPLAIDAAAVRRRLEVIRNLIVLGEQTEVPPHMRKLHPLAEALHLTSIIDCINRGEYRTAIEHIDEYLKRASALVVSDIADIPRLRFQLEMLEVQLESFSDEKAELERKLIIFNRRYDEELGELIRDLLKMLAKKARLRAECLTEKEGRTLAEHAAHDSEQAWRDYVEKHEALQNSLSPPRLSEESERELKLLYRKACSLCHPDKAPDARKAQAHQTFVELQDAFKSNDLKRVRTIHEMLTTSGMPTARSNTLSEADALQAAIAELEHLITAILAQIKELWATDGARMMEVAGSTEVSWNAYFMREREVLEKQLKTLEAELRAALYEERPFHA